MALKSGRVGVRNDQVDCYGRIKENGIAIDTLWTNSSPLRNFEAQTLNDVSISGYKILLIQYLPEKLASAFLPKFIFTTQILTSDTTNIFVLQCMQSNGHVSQRRCSISGGKIVFEDCNTFDFYGQSNTTERNENIIPYKILGIK